MTGDPKRHRRVTWKLRRAPDGWLPVILIGEEPVTFAVIKDKHEARTFARRRASEMRHAGQQ